MYTLKFLKYESPSLPHQTGIMRRKNFPVTSGMPFSPAGPQSPEISHRIYSSSPPEQIDFPREPGRLIFKYPGTLISETGDSSSKPSLRPHHQSPETLDPFRDPVKECRRYRPPADTFIIILLILNAASGRHDHVVVGTGYDRNAGKLAGPA